MPPSDVILDREVVQSASKRLGIDLIPAEAHGPNDLETAFRLLSGEHLQAVIVLVDAMLYNERERIAVLAATARLPAVCGFRDHVAAGDLISYGVNLADNFHHAAAYVDKIVKGAKPGDLPVEFPTKLETAINLKTAKVRGLTVPTSLLARSHEAIE